MQTALYGTNLSIIDSVCALRHEYNVVYCVRGITVTKRCKSYDEAVNLVNRLREKYKRISTLCIYEIIVFIE